MGTKNTSDSKKRHVTPHTAKPKPHTATCQKNDYYPADYNYFRYALILMRNKKTVLSWMKN